MDQVRRGYLYGTAAFLCWGFFPLYFHALRPAGPVEILAHRVLWSVVVVTLLLTIVRRWSGIRPLLRQRRSVVGIAGSAALIAINWGTYIYGVNSGRVVETSLGYFINPLISVLFGLAFFAERLRRWQWLAVGMGAVAVAVLTVDYGRPPWIALTLAMSFGSYGLLKKHLGLPPAEGLLLESAALALPALGYLTWLSARGDGTFTGSGWAHTVLLAASGFFTAVPLLLFAGAANRVPLVGLGILQYLAPSLQLAVGLFVFHEPMPQARLAGFALVWLALAIFTVDALRAARSRRLTSGDPAAVPAGHVTAADQTPGQAHAGDVTMADGPVQAVEAGAGGRAGPGGRRSQVTW